jgi:hypothetical protein
MTLISKLLLGTAALMAVVNLTLPGSTGDWALPVIVAVTASPAFRPGKVNLLLAICSLIGMIVSQLAHNHAANLFAIISAVASMVLAFVNWRLTRQVNIV